MWIWNKDTEKRKPQTTLLALFEAFIRVSDKLYFA